MKLILKFVALFILAVLIAMLSNYGPGHVIVFIKNYRIDLSFTTLILSVLIFYLVIYYLYMLLSDIYNLPFRFNRYRKKRALIKSRNYFNIAATNYFQSNYDVAYNNALKAISKDFSTSNKFPIFLLAIETIQLMDIEDDDKKTSARISKLLSKLSNKQDLAYIYSELKRINEIKNNKFYAEILNKIKSDTQLS